MLSVDRQAGILAKTRTFPLPCEIVPTRVQSSVLIGGRISELEIPETGLSALARHERTGGRGRECLTLSLQTT
jgi:hypothetical protein